MSNAVAYDTCGKPTLTVIPIVAVLRTVVTPANKKKRHFICKNSPNNVEYKQLLAYIHVLTLTWVFLLYVTV